MNEVTALDTFRANITAAVDYMKTSPDQVEIHVEPVHRFAEGLYAREFTSMRTSPSSSRDPVPLFRKKELSTTKHRRC
jgi:hypothetical protein